MCNKNHDFNPIRCIIPSYMTDKLMQSNDEGVAANALQSEMQSAAIRGKRRFVASLDATEKRNFFGTAVAPKKVVMKMQVYNIKHSTQTGVADLLWENGTILKKLDRNAADIVKAGTQTWDFYFKIFGRNSIDNLGMMIKHYAHYGNTEDDMNNAMWTGTEMVYGDGDGRIFGSFTSDPDIIGHELTHGVTQYESNLRYHNQSGALNESLSDVFGIMIKQRMMNEDVKKSNWLIGENVLLGNKYALRSMIEPGKAYRNHPDLGDDPQPATMAGFVHLPDTTRGDNGGVHYNSGIPNFAFCRTALEIGGFSWEKAGRIWYEAMTDTKKLKPDATFADFKALTIAKATTLFGGASKETKAVKKGWADAQV